MHYFLIFILPNGLHSVKANANNLNISAHAKNLLTPVWAQEGTINPYATLPLTSLTGPV